MFTIDPCEEAFIYKAWRTKAEKWLCNMFHEICENDANTHWLTDDILQALRAWWDSPEFKAKQVKAQASRRLARCGSLHTGGSTTVKGMQLRMVNMILYSFNYSISVLNIIWLHENCLKYKRRRWVGHRLRGNCFERPTPESMTSSNGLILD